MKYKLDSASVDLPTANRFVQWLYAGRTDIDYESSPEDSENKDTKDEMQDLDDQPYEPLVNLYLFADQYQIVGLMNHAIDNICSILPPEDKEKNIVILPNHNLIQKVWSSTPTSSALRKVVIYIYLYHLHDKYFETEGLELFDACPEFMTDLVPFMCRSTNGM